MGERLGKINEKDVNILLSPRPQYFEKYTDWGQICMKEFVFEAWQPWLLGIGGGSLILSMLLLLFTNSYTKKKLKEMEQEDAKT